MQSCKKAKEVHMNAYEHLAMHRERERDALKKRTHSSGPRAARPSPVAIAAARLLRNVADRLDGAMARQTGCSDLAVAQGK